MPGSVKVSGTWRGVAATSVKVSGTWRSVTQAWVKVAGVWVAWFTALITDAFNRTTSGSLGTADTGQTWTNQRGTWYATGSQARSDGTASSYPLASVPLGSQNNTTSVSTSNGVGPAFWIVDSNNWWASYSHSTSSTSSVCGGGATGNIYTSQPPCPCGSPTSGTGCGGGATSWSTSDPGTCACGSLETRTTSSPTQVYYKAYGSCSGGDAIVPCSQGGTDCSTVNPPQCGVDGVVCCQVILYFTEYRCTDSLRPLYGCSDSQITVTTYNHYLRIISSVGGTVSTATGDVSLPSAAAAVKVIANGNSVNSYAYSDTTMTSQIGTNSVTPSSPNRGTATGIVKAPSSYLQGSTADNFSSAAQ